MKFSLLSIIFLFSIVTATSQINNEHLNIGDIAPQIIGVDQFNNKIDSELILQDNLEKFKEKGVYVIVVTPESVDKIKETANKFNATFSIIHDIDNTIMNNYKVAFDVNKNNVPNYFEFTLKKVREYNESENDVLPVPATYVIDKNRKISYVHYSADYSIRSNFNEILAKI